MTLLEQFRAADAKVNEIEKTKVIFDKECVNTEDVREWEEALSEAQNLYLKCVESGINPF